MYRFLFAFLIFSTIQFSLSATAVEDSSELLQRIKRGGVVEVAAGNYNFSTDLVILKPVQIIAQGKVNFNFTHDFTTAINIKSSSVLIRGISLEGKQSYISKKNKYLIKAEGAGINNVRIEKCIINNFGNINEDNSKATHAIYFSGIQDASVTNCRINKISGAAIFVKNCSKVHFSNNNISNTGWYSIHLDHSVTNFSINDNIISGTLANIRKHGGSIDLMSQHRPKGAPNAYGKIYRNTITGIHSYGSAIRILSSRNITVAENKLNNCKSNSAAPISLIRIGRRGDKVSGTFNVACEKLLIKQNSLICGEPKQRGIVVDNEFIKTNNPHRGIKMLSNSILDSPQYSFEFFMILNPNAGGFEKVLLKKNNLETSASTSEKIYGIYYNDVKKNQLNTGIVIKKNTTTLGRNGMKQSPNFLPYEGLTEKNQQRNKIMSKQ